MTARAKAGESRIRSSLGFAASCKPATPRSPAQRAMRPSGCCTGFFARHVLCVTTRRMWCCSVSQGGGAGILPRRSLGSLSAGPVFCAPCRRAFPPLVSKARAPSSRGRWTRPSFCASSLCRRAPIAALIDAKFFGCASHPSFAFARACSQVWFGMTPDCISTSGRCESQGMCPYSSWLADYMRTHLLDVRS